MKNNVYTNTFIQYIPVLVVMVLEDVQKWNASDLSFFYFCLMESATQCVYEFAGWWNCGKIEIIFNISLIWLMPWFEVFVCTVNSHYYNRHSFESVFSSFSVFAILFALVFCLLYAVCSLHEMWYVCVALESNIVFIIHITHHHHHYHKSGAATAWLQWHSS